MTRRPGLRLDLLALGADPAPERAGLLRSLGSWVSGWIAGRVTR